MATRLVGDGIYPCTYTCPELHVRVATTPTTGGTPLTPCRPKQPAPFSVTRKKKNKIRTIRWAVLNEAAAKPRRKAPDWLDPALVHKLQQPLTTDPPPAFFGARSCTFANLPCYSPISYLPISRPPMSLPSHTTLALAARRLPCARPTRLAPFQRRSTKICVPREGQSLPVRLRVGIG